MMVSGGKMQSLRMKIMFAALKTIGRCGLEKTTAVRICFHDCLPVLWPFPVFLSHGLAFSITTFVSLRKWPYGWRNLRNVISFTQRCWSLLLEQVNDTKSPRSAFSLHLCCLDSAMIRCLYLRPFTSKGLLLLFPNDISQRPAKKSEAVPFVISSRGFAVHLCARDESLFTDPVAPKGNSYVRLLFVT